MPANSEAGSVVGIQALRPNNHMTWSPVRDPTGGVGLPPSGPDDAGIHEFVGFQLD